MNRDEIFNIIVEHICEVLPKLENYNFQYDNQLSALGANSIDRADIVIMTLESLSLRMPLTETLKASNIGQLADLLYEKLQS